MPPLPYAKALELKNAGWPQPDYIDEADGKWTYQDEHMVQADRAYSPSLEELIEGCGREKIVNDHRYLFIMYFVHTIAGDFWRALFQSDHGNHELWISDGENPKEAVANLWLSLPPEMRSK
jgi:hypothetical protein